ncbi:hypothetical protein F0562_028726 [Nyssa sinensis]|uniref:GRF-type domain-containing protein n=1 Tax=Nyssa sinensis TaxID=561372 RepID=A0A5J5B0Z1_9ASTE|nr:hypothetical protein F0562_028726 [Nyssa sinensis]
MMSTLKNSELKCSCGLTVKLRISRTAKNPYRLFYNCPKGFDDQCEFFQWCDEPSPTDDKHVDELNLVRNECIRLQQSIDDIQQERNNDRSAWNREKTELTSQLSSVKDELDKIKMIMKQVNESDLMPPFEKLSIEDDEVDDAVVLHMV